MTKDIYSTFEEHEFFGEFFHAEDSCEARFVGKIHYSTDRGLTLQYNIAEIAGNFICSYGDQNHYLLSLKKRRKLK